MPNNLYLRACISSSGFEHSTVVVDDAKLLRYVIRTILCSTLSFLSKTILMWENISHGNLRFPPSSILTCFAHDKCDCHDSSDNCNTVLPVPVMTLSVWVGKWKINLTLHLYSSISLSSSRKRWYNVSRVLPENVRTDGGSKPCFECSSLFKSHNFFNCRWINFGSVCLLMSDEA
jgi:hypothetical protein